MTTLLLFALAWAMWRGLEQVGREARTGTARAYRVSRERACRQAAVRAAHIRRRGTPAQKAALWAGTTGVAATRAAGRGLIVTGRGAYRAGRSFYTGWRAGWAEGKTRHADYVQRRRHSQREKTVRDHDARTVHDGGSPAARSTRPYGLPADDHPGGNERAAPTPTSTARPVIETPGHPAGSPHKAPGEGEGGTVVSIPATGPTTGEAPNIEAAREALKAIAEQAEETNTTIDQLSASLSSADMDPDTLGEVSEILEAADALKTSADHALAGLDNRHQVMEEAVNSTPHAARTEFYRHN